MEVKMALAVGLFFVICGPPGLKSSQVVPDGLVYTEVQKTVVRGVEAVLTCRFNGGPLAVYWRKGLDPDDLSLMVAWNGGRVSGPSFDDGSCDVDENYSLIIKNVSTADVGRIYCTVSNNKGPPMTNYTDIVVLDTAITTNQRVTLQLREATYGILQCTVHINARRVSWKKETTSSANGSLILIENNQGVAERSGAGYDDGTYNITQDYSLVIKEVQVHHEGLYVCEVTDDTGISFRNHTFVNVVAQPLEPFPTIQECLNAEPHDSNYCTLVAKSGMTLTCQAVKYYPSINLVFLYGSRVLKPSDTREWNTTDGTKNKTITIAPGDNKELYTCVASNTPGTNENKSTSVLFHGEEPVKSTLVIIIVSCSVLIAASIIISSAAYFYIIWRKKQVSHPPDQSVSYSAIPRSDSNEELEDFDVKELTETEWQKFKQDVDNVLMKHYKSIHDTTHTESFQAEHIIIDNGTALFDTHQMLTDWRQRPTSTRSQLRRADRYINIVADESGADSDHDWPTNGEVKSISRHLTQESMKEICKELHIAYSYDDAKDEGKRFDSLCDWRTEVSKLKKPLKERLDQLYSVLGSNDLGGLLPTLTEPCIYKAELVDLAFRLLMHDLYPIAKALGINATKLASYRPAFDHSHLKFGTIKLLIELQLRGDDIYHICGIMAYPQYQNFALAQKLEYDMSYGELCSISEAINQSARRRADQDKVGFWSCNCIVKGTVWNRSEKVDHLASTSGMIPEELANLQDVLQLTDQDIADRPDTSHPLTAFVLFKIWKEKPRPLAFNYRAALAQELRRTGMPDLAKEIIAGKYITEQTSLAFIEDMVRGSNEEQIRSLGELLQLSGENEHWHTSTPGNEITKQIYNCLVDWTTRIQSSWHRNVSAKVTPEMKTTAEEHRDLNDRLIEHGFLDLAREMNNNSLGCRYAMKNFLKI